MKKFTLVFACLMLLVSPSWAATRTVVLSVPDMSCAACPVTVKKSLRQVEGVLKADISLDKRIAIVTYDDARTTIQALMQATTDAGYPSALK